MKLLCYYLILTAALAVSSQKPPENEDVVQLRGSPVLKEFAQAMASGVSVKQDDSEAEHFANGNDGNDNEARRFANDGSECILTGHSCYVGDTCCNGVCPSCNSPPCRCRSPSE